MVLLQERRREEIEANRKKENDKMKEDERRKIRQERVRSFINNRLAEKRSARRAKGFEGWGQSGSSRRSKIPLKKER